MADKITTELDKGQQEGEAEKNLRAALESITATEPEGKPEKIDGEPAPIVEKKPEETKPEKTETTATEEPDPTEGLPDDRPTPDHWKTARERMKELHRQIRELKKPKEVEAVTETVSPEPIQTMPQTTVVPAKPQEPIDPDAVFNVIARVEAGELDATYLKEAKQYITSRMSPAEVAAVYRKAQAGYFGDSSQVIEDACAKFLPIVQQNSAAREQEQTAAAKAVTTRAKSWETVFNANKKLADKTSPEAREFSEANEVLIQQFPDLWNRPEAPLIILKFAEVRGKAIKADTIEKEMALLKAENAELKKRQNHNAAPISTTGGNSTTIKTAEDRLREGLAEAGF